MLRVVPRNTLRTPKILAVCRTDDDGSLAKTGVRQPMAQNAANAAKQTNSVRSGRLCLAEFIRGFCSSAHPGNRWVLYLKYAARVRIVQ